VTRPETALIVLEGLTDYEEALGLQRDIVARRRENEAPDTLILLEHPPVITLGRHADPAGVVAAQDELSSRGIGVHRIERGGQVTYHGPGQVVGYPIMDLRRRGMGVGDYVHGLEDVMVRAAAALGVEARRQDGVVGVFTDLGKIGAIGVRVARGISFHGFAFNVEPDLTHYRFIVPCGMAEVPVTSILGILGTSPGLPAARDALSEAFEEVFAVRLRPA
jgi:lipoate-protein ligase B